MYMFNKLKERLKGWSKKFESEKDSGKSEKVAKKSVKSKNPKADKKLEKKQKEVKKNVKKEIKKEVESVDEVKGEKSRFDVFRKKVSEEKFEELFSELEMGLLQNNVALEVVDKIKTGLKEKLVGRNVSGVDVEKDLKEVLEGVMIDGRNFIKEIKGSLAAREGPFVILFVGINGTGKTTSLAKVASLLKKEKLSCVLAAGDTYRAAAIEQLKQHAENLKLHMVSKDYGADSASVGFDAIAYAKKNHIDVVLIDSAGRMNTNESLMKEVGKISRVTKADMKIFVGESIAGNDSIEQAKNFNDVIDLNGIILTKADVDEKGGAALSIGYVTKKPILFLGVGQDYKDLQEIDKAKVLDSLFG